MNQKRILPVFPLDLVLFPRQELPIRVFEPRYKQLVDDCMVGDGQFGVCLVDPGGSVGGWDAPRSVGTVAKITRCRDVGLDGMQLHVETVGRNKFRIGRIIPPSVGQPPDYDPYTLEGHRAVSHMHEMAGTGGKMYIRAEAEMIPEIDEDVPAGEWEGLVEMWKSKVARQALPRIVEPRELDRVLEQYYLATDVPTVDYVYSLSALGAGGPEDLQPILEADTMAGLIRRVRELMTVK